MNVNTITGALLAALLSFANALLALFVNDAEMTFAMIKQAAWVSMILGAVIQFIKDYQALSVRRLVNNVSGTGDGGI